MTPTDEELEARIAITDHGVVVVYEVDDPNTVAWTERRLTALALGCDGREYGESVSLQADAGDLWVAGARRQLMKSLHHHMAERAAWADPLPTANEFMVGSNGRGHVSIMGYLPGQVISADRALGLAAWIIMCATYGETARLNKILDAIQNA